MDRAPEPSRLITLLRQRTEYVTVASLLHCEETMPGLAGMAGRDRELGLAIIRYGTELRLTLAAEQRETTEQEDSYFRDYFAGAVERGIPLDVQLQIIRRTIAFTIGHYWEVAGRDHTDEMLVFSARTSRFHHRLEQILVETYCQRLGSDLTAERLRRAHADALLSGDSPPPTGGVDLPLATSYLVLVIPGDAGPPPPLHALAADGRFLHTVREGADVALVPLEPDGREVAEKLAMQARDAGRRAAAATPAVTPDDVPQAYAEARRLLEVSAAMRRPPTIVTAEDALPETLLDADRGTAERLAGVLDAIAGSPELLETLWAFADSDLDRTATAERLFIHRRTLNQRLHRIRDLTGHDPRTSRGLLVLGLALIARGMRRR
ncbi:MAG TPA: helix-turn-helix domain-containing protein [Pseudonocardia sp.]|nr:helix-turn-helix domain-containing protein [Pseudonocardia sp.]